MNVFAQSTEHNTEPISTELPAERQKERHAGGLFLLIFCLSNWANFLSGDKTSEAYSYKVILEITVYEAPVQLLYFQYPQTLSHLCLSRVML